MGGDADSEGGAGYYATSRWVVDLTKGTVMEGVDAAEAAVGIALPCDGVSANVTVVAGKCGQGKYSGGVPGSVFWGANELVEGFDTEFATLSRAVELEVDLVQNQDTVIIG